MRDVNGSSFALLLDQGDWAPPSVVGTNEPPLGAVVDMTWTASAWTLAGEQTWRLPATRTDTRTVLAGTPPVVVDAYGGMARIAVSNPPGLSIESWDGAAWTNLEDQNLVAIAPKVGKFIAMSLGGSRLALISSNGANAYLELFDISGRWPLDTPENPSIPLSLDPGGVAIAVAPDGPIFVFVQGGLAIFEGGPIDELFAPPIGVFLPVSANPNPLRQTALLQPPALAHAPSGGALAMAVDARRVAVLINDGTGVQTIALLDRASGSWTSTPIDKTQLPYMTDVAFMRDGFVALMAPPSPSPASGPVAPLDCAVVTVSPQGLSLAPRRYPMLTQYAPRFAAVPGPDVYYLGVSPAGEPAPTRLLPLPYPGYRTRGALARFSIPGNDPDQTWHRLYAEAYLAQGTALTIWARAAETQFGETATATDQAALAAILLAATPDVKRLDGANVAIVAKNGAQAPPSAALIAALTLAPFHRQPPLAAVSQPSELPFHRGLASLAGMPGALYEVLLQRSVGSNRRLTGAFLDLVAVATGDGRHSPCLRAIRVYSNRFSYQDQYLPTYFRQTKVSDETDVTATASPPDFRERLMANFEGLLTPIEDRVAAAEYLLDPKAAPISTLPWLFSYFGRTLDPSWPEARSRRALANIGLQFRRRGTYRGVCLALDIATDGAVARGEVVVLETFRLRRSEATVLGVPMNGRNSLTGYGVQNGNSIIGDTLTLSAERSSDLIALLAPSAARTSDPSAASQLLEEYADRFQVTVLLQGPTAAALRPVVTSVLQAELPAQLSFDIAMTDQRFILGLSPLLSVDTFLDAPAAPALLTLDQNVIGRDAIVRNPAALRQ
jgi:phage tail-like protein